MASVGLTEEQGISQGMEIVIGKSQFTGISSLIVSFFYLGFKSFYHVKQNILPKHYILKS
ncbi:hypothetical protein [Desulfosporosinus orientis]|uniref:hypothetical protein n=1 Tax=Desulfosporosinus orientis TaxID=1563 RepID=UPI003CFD61DF